MRQIKFRAKTLYNDDCRWVFGNYCYTDKEQQIIELDKPCRIHNIIPLTVCQSTGLKDKDGMDIFENDYIEIEYRNTSLIMFVFWNKNTCGWSIENIHLIDFIEYNKSDLQFLNGQQQNIKVIGNKIDNPELIKERLQAKC